MSDEALYTALARALSGAGAVPALHVAFSGGLDSTVLLHLLIALSRRQPLPPIHAIHVHHGLQATADAWPAHCRQVCAALGVPLRIERVRVRSGASLEEAARQARYAAFSRALGPGEWLLVAQHRDDQAETLLFRLLRGAGVRGLAAMAPSRALGRGRLLRPLLDVSRTALEDYARRHGLRWVEDPSNQDVHYSRNFLRHQVLPLLQARWPQAQASLARSAAHLGDAQQLLDELAVDDLARAQRHSEFAWLNLPALALAPLASLSEARQRNALRHWLAPLTRLPDTDHWAGWKDLRDARPAAHPLWRLADGELHRADGHVWWLAGDWLHPPCGGLHWSNPAHALRLPGNGTLSFSAGAPPGPFEVRYRQGGEVMGVPGRGQRDLKRLLNETRLPGFVRARLPLVFQDGRLLAVANLAGLDRMGENGAWLCWHAPTSDQSLR
ncbi:tRNA(Ile)-lysidine synthase [Pseudomonas sp. Leaf127]|uniref:tRNA lysidine(34) synthetase TilS n=1 Tax=Pseudomonas sp. Leaf127 TaxID=1736267 RepID=UPI00070319B0|nr:tRNA lysidine(34) synthetase TilS [Pseudomonas sp. Leaf127]KQQ68076.1 tRNA(Ile)-lysidine synthase [Pseudomonas sp. Leaf127]